MAKNNEITQVELEEAGVGKGGSDSEKIAALERALAGIYRNTRNIRGVLHFQSFATDPSTGNEGDLVVVAGKLKIYTSGAWTVVGTQT